MRTIVSFCLLFLVFSPGMVCAASGDNLMQDVFMLDALTVTGEVEEEQLDRTSAIVVEKNRSNNVADFLVRDPEISFKRKAAFGDSSDIISIRGFESKRIMLNLDNRNIVSTGTVGGNYIDFGTIPLDNIERIEVIKGGSSVEYGNTALGGVINAYTRRPTEDPYVSLYGTLGGWDDPWDFYTIRGSYSQKFNALGVSLGISQQHADAFLRNNDYDSFHVNPKLYLDLPWQAELTLGYNYSVTERGLIRSNRADGNPTADSNPNLPGFNTAIDSRYPVASGEYFAGGAPGPSMNVIGDGAYWTKTRHLMDITYFQEILDTAYFEVMAYKNYETRREKNYADVDARMQLKAMSPPPDTFNPALTRNGAMVLDRDIVVDESYGYKFKTGTELSGHDLMAGLEYKKLKSGKTDVKFVDENYNKHGSNGWTGQMESSGAGPGATIWGAFLGDTYGLTDQLTLDAGLRFDSYHYEPEGQNRKYTGEAVSPKAMLTYAFTDNQSASIAAYQNYRTPSMPELYWASQASSYDNSINVPYLIGENIKPETARGLDIAYKYNFSANEFIKLSGFYYSVQDYIVHKPVYVPRPPSNQAWAAYNVDAEIYGLTLGGSYALLNNLKLHGTATWQDNKKRNDPSDPDNTMKKLEYIPEWKGSLGLSWQIDPSWNLDTSLTYVGERKYYINTANLSQGTLHDYITLGASLGYKFNEQLSFEAYADNIAGTHYEESWGYPAMGFNAGVSCKWVF